MSATSVFHDYVALYFLYLYVHIIFILTGSEGSGVGLDWPGNVKDFLILMGQGPVPERLVETLPVEFSGTVSRGETSASDFDFREAEV